MSKQVHHFKKIVLVLVGMSLLVPAHLYSAEQAQIKDSKTSFYRDIFDQNFFYEGTGPLHLKRLKSLITRKKARSRDVNVYDEVPDSPFFVNRHAKARLSTDQLEKGYRENDGLDLAGNLTVLDGQFLGLYPDFLIVQDQKGDRYTIAFDPPDHLELSTASEIIASRFIYAIGFNVPQYTIVSIMPEKLVTDERSVIVDNSGFKRKLTAEKLQESLLFLGQDEQGNYRASVRKAFNGIEKGGFSFVGRRKEDLLDSIDHKDRREIRALRVFASWLGLYRITESNTMDVLISEGENQSLKHYLYNFNSAFGSIGDGSKLPKTSHEYLFDFGDMAKSILKLGWWEKPWQKRWREAGMKTNSSVALGYFDNNYFNPGKFKTQLPYFAFKDLSSADAFWAAKIIMSFSDQDIAAMVKAGQLSKQEDTNYLIDILSKRRDLIGKYWFERSAALDRFKLDGNVLSFTDLSIQYGFEKKENTIYGIDLYDGNVGEKSKIETIKTENPSIDLDRFFGRTSKIILKIWVYRSGASAPSFVTVGVDSKGIFEIIHKD